MSDLIRTDTIFGKRANIVGNISADLVLESLGKIYIKSRNSAKTLEEVILSLVTDDAGSTASRTLIVEGIENLTNVKEGLLIYDKLSNILYIWLDDNPLELINVSPEGTEYVKRTGDTMTGRLTINVPNGAPLYVNSNTLVENLNANYLEGNPASAFTRRTVDENITGKWTFRSPTKFESNTWFGQDIIAGGSIGTRNFVGGFGGYGWRLDAETNTLTIDNLIVRKLMQVYELVVNRISATNGSLWVTNAGKVTKAYKLPIFSANEITSLTVDFNSKIVSLLDLTSDNAYFIIFPSSVSQGDVYTTFSGNHLLNASGSNRNTATLTTYSTVARSQAYIVNINDRSQLGSIVSLVQEINGENVNVYVYDLTTTFSAHNIPTTKENNPAYKIYKLFSDNFKFDTRLPIIARDYYHAYLASEYQRKEYDKAIINLLNVNISTYVSRAEASYPDALKGLKDGNNNPRFLTSDDVIAYTYSYYKYYASGDFYIVTFDDDLLPVFKPGDLLRCQKWTYGGIKYYDAIVCNYVDESTYIIQLADSVFDKLTKISYDDNLLPTVVEGEEVENETLYNLSGRTSFDLGKTDSNGNAIEDSIIGIVEEKDSLVLMGNLWDTQRLNAVYITSTDDGAPYMDVLSGLNRPDFSVIYYTPLYETVKLYAKNAVPGVTNVAIPYTGDYYVQNNVNLSEYILGTVVVNGATETVLVPSSTNGWQQWLTSKAYLSTTPNANTKLLKADTYGDITGQNDDFNLVTEDNQLNIIQEQVTYGLTANSTKTTKVRIGNLDGIQDDLFPIDKLPYGYGLYGSNVFLIGEFYLSNGRSLAEISNEAITFATAARDASLNGLDLLRRDTNIIKERLQKEIERLDNNTYKIDQLKTAGMMLSGNVMLLWGGSIQMYTLKSELDGEPIYSRPTALFEDGYISAKFLKVDRALSTFDYFVVTDEIFTCGGITYKALSDPRTPGFDSDKYNVRVYIRKKVIKNFEDQYIKTIDLLHSETIYCRKFTPNDNSGDIWLLVTPDGKPIYNNGNVVPVTYYYYQEGQNSPNPIQVYTGGKFGEHEVPFILEDTEPIKRWALQIDGKGNLGGNNLFWDYNTVTVSGTLYSSNGIIGGLTLSENKLYYKDTNKNYYPFIIGTLIYSNNSIETLPYILLNSVPNMVNNYGITHSVVLHSKGLFYLPVTRNTGLKRKLDYLNVQVPGNIFQLTVIPIMDINGRWSFYARLSCGSNAFSRVNIAWHPLGRYFLNFDYLNSTHRLYTLYEEWKQEKAWFIEQLIAGNIHFQITGLNAGWYSQSFEDNFTNHVTTILNLQVSKYFAFNPLYMYYNSARFGIDEESLKTFQFSMFLPLDNRLVPADYTLTLRIRPSIEQISYIGGSYNFNPDMANYLTLEKIRNDCTLGVVITATKDCGDHTEGGIIDITRQNRGLSNLFGERKWENIIGITTGNEDQLRAGGFTLTCLYSPAFDDRALDDNTDLDADLYDDTISAEEQVIIQEILTFKSTYGTNGTVYTELTLSLNTKLGLMSDDAKEALLNIIDNIRYNIYTAGGVADSVKTNTLSSELANWKRAVESLYGTAETNINNLSTSASSSNSANITVTPVSLSSSSTNGTVKIADYSTSLSGTPTILYLSGSLYLSSLAVPNSSIIIASAGENTGATRSETLRLTIGNYHYDFTVTLEGSSSGGDLDLILAMVLPNNSPLNIAINQSNTPQTYAYLLSGYSYLSSLGNTYVNNLSKTWFIANMLAELTPYTSYASAYFYNAAWNDGGHGVNTVDATTVPEYENRNKGAFAYSLFKNNNLTSSFDAADSARAELRLKGISVAAMRSGDFTEISDTEVVHALDITTGISATCSVKDNTINNNNKRVLPLSHPSVASGSYDYNYTNNLVTNYPNVSSIANYNGVTGGYQPLLDKFHTTNYLISVLGLSSSASTLINKLLDYTGKESGRLKYAYYRRRPNLIFGTSFILSAPCSGNTTNSNGVYGVYLADVSKKPSGETAKTLDGELYKYAIGYNLENYRCANACSSTDALTSFPSGHSVLAYMVMLASVEAYGNTFSSGNYTSRETRTNDYCENRAVVRAHWKTDTVIGKLVSSMLIGFLNGFTSFKSLVGGGSSNNSSCNNCDVGSRFVGGNGNGAFGDYCRQSGYNTGRPYIIGFYKHGDCSPNITPTFDPQVKYTGVATLDEFMNMWSGVTINVTTATQKDENGNNYSLPGDYTHYVTASYIPANTTGKTVSVRFYCVNPECRRDGGTGSVDYFTFNQYA